MCNEHKIMLMKTVQERNQTPWFSYTSKTRNNQSSIVMFLLRFRWLFCPTLWNKRTVFRKFKTKRVRSTCDRKSRINDFWCIPDEIVRFFRSRTYYNRFSRDRYILKPDECTTKHCDVRKEIQKQCT